MIIFLKNAYPTSIKNHLDIEQSGNIINYHVNGFIKRGAHGAILKLHVDPTKSLVIAFLANGKEKGIIKYTQS